jgi:hypothetical protein
MTQGLNIRAIAVFVIAIILAIWLGVSIVTDQIDTLIKFGGVGLLLVSALLGRRIWLLMMLFSALNFPLIRGFNTTQLGYALFVGFSVLMILTRRLPARFILGELEWWMLLMALCIVQVYLRNPVGLNLFGGSSVGGKPYFLVGIAFLTAIILGAYRVNPRELKWAMYISFFGGLIGIPIDALRNRSSMAAFEASQGGAAISQADPEAMTRMGSLGGIATILARWIVSRVNPLKACLHPLWGLLILITLAAAAGSGFRNAVANVGLIYIFGLVYRGGFASVLFASIVGTLFIAALATINVFAPLPLNVQRTLTIFPGTWDQTLKDDANGSTDWRIVMWKEALLTDHWIQNKWLGDGLGMSAAELARSQELQKGGKGNAMTGLSVHQENAMISGDYHSGPVQTIRTVGYVGLAVMLLAMIRIAVHGHRQIQRCRGTEWFPLSIYFCIGSLINPIFFVFVFGTFTQGASSVFMSVAMMRLLENNLPLPPYVKPKHRHYLLKSHHSPDAAQGS